MRNIITIIFAALLLFSCNKESVSYIDLPSINETYEFNAKGGKSLGTVISNTEFEMISDSPWCQVIIYKDNAVNNFRIDVEENLFAVTRTAVITITADDCNPRTIKVKQEAAGPTLSADKTRFEFDQNSAAFTVEITSNLNVEISYPSWISMDPEAGIAMGTNLYNFYVEATTEEYRSGKIVIDAVDYPDKKVEIEVSQVAATSVLFEDDFSWTESLFADGKYSFVTGAITPDKWPEEAFATGWSSTIYTGCGEEGSVQAKAATGFLTLPFYAKRPTDIITPKLTKVSGTRNLTVTFKACTYYNGSAAEGYREIHVSCIGPGTVSQENFTFSNQGTNKNDSWQEAPEATRSFDIEGATNETQVVFHFGPVRPATDDMKKDINVIPTGEANCNCRMGFDDVKIIYSNK